MASSEGKISRREFLQASIALPICLAIPLGKGNAANENEHLTFAQPSYGRGAYGSGPYGIDSYNLYLPIVHKKGE